MMTEEFELAFAPEPFDQEVGGDDRARTLEIVARWLVRDLIEKTGLRDVGELTSTAFTVMHPELGGRRIDKGEKALIADYNRIQRDLVAPLLASGASAPAPSVSAAGTASLPALGGARVPAGYKLTRRENTKGVLYDAGLAKYSGDRLETTLRGLMKQGVLSVTENELDTFQRIANVETSGGTQALNTWDSAVVSIGWFQLTLQHGKLQRLIRRAPQAFARYGIALDEGRKYTMGKEQQVAIKNAATTTELRWNGWAQRFYLAGLDPEIIAAEVEDGRQILKTGKEKAKKYLAGITGGFELFEKAYEGSLPLRGLYQEAINNLPMGGYEGIQLAMKRALKEGASDPAEVYAIAKTAMVDALVARGDPKSGANIVKKTASGARGS